MLKRNLIANYLGQGWVAVMGLVFIPVYIRHLGMEAYGLIGLYAMLQAWLGLLDMGMTPTLSREMARFTGGQHSAQSIRDLLRSVEVIGLCIAAVMAGSLWALSGWIASDWLRSEKLPVRTVANAFAIMGMVAALRFIEGLYRSAIVGLQRQVLLNAVASVMATIRGLGAVAVLIWISPTIQAFFLWQGIVSVSTVIVLASATYAALPSSYRPGRFSREALRAVGSFAGGMLGVTVLALLLTQVDKILLSRLLTLSEYGRYTLAATAAGAASLLISPITQAFFPRLTHLHSSGSDRDLSNAFHQGSQLVTVVFGTACLTIFFYTDPLLMLWLHDPELAQKTVILVKALIVGSLVAGMMMIPYQTQLAHGWTGLAVRINIGAVCLVVPAMFWAANRYGALGAACVMAGLNTCYLLFEPYFMHKRILKMEKWRWYLEDIAIPLGAATCVFALSHGFVRSQQRPLGSAIALVATSTIALCVSFVLASHLRTEAWSYLLKLTSHGTKP
ncbi:MAG: oligosaccharide flippase family protein [Polyangia bacterium]